MRDMDINYTVSSFLQDLSKIREQTFKKGTIIKAFRELGMWLLSFSIIKKKIVVYAPPQLSTPPPHLEASLCHEYQGFTLCVAHSRVQGRSVR